MKTQILDIKEFNSGELHPLANKEITIKRGRYIENDGTSHPLYIENDKFFKQIDALSFNKKHIYYITRFGQKESQHGFHIGLSFMENQKFLWLQNKHWLQKEENTRYLINLLFLILGVYIGFKNLK
jgi:hypothetical protein